MSVGVLFDSPPVLPVTEWLWLSKLKLSDGRKSNQENTLQTTRITYTIYQTVPNEINICLLLVEVVEWFVDHHYQTLPRIFLLLNNCLQHNRYQGTNTYDTHLDTFIAPVTTLHTFIFPSFLSNLISLPTKVTVEMMDERGQRREWEIGVEHHHRDMHT